MGDNPRMTIEDTEQTEDVDLPESKSARKRAAQSAQDLGEALLKLDRGDLDRLALPERLIDAVIAARAITSHAARRRQMQYIGKLMRGVDVEPIQRALDIRAGLGGSDRQLQREAEAWRERLLTEGDEALRELEEQFPQADMRMFGKLLRDAAQPNAHTSTTAKRMLFRSLRALIEQPSS